MLHCVKSQASSIVVCSCDTDVLVLLLAHFIKMSCLRVWMKSGTSKKRKCIPVHSVADQFDSYIFSILLAFHSLTGPNTTTFLAGYTKKSCWKIFKEHHNLLSTLGEGDLSATALVLMLNPSSTKLTQVTVSAKSTLFAQAHLFETLPTTQCPVLSHEVGKLPSISIATGKLVPCTTSTSDYGMEN